ncbi:MAG: hypothetical protein F6K48_24905 [Okeania sp. SIO3H1]|uniref:hypothetical protein n=1 Tax=Okeania sp. SIO1I7 TaxID=2607772 RepID=UPI0013C7DFAB|nr:hypothetical protein [Okeania sp. SIO1I7]NEN91970.1 hypothetical protein [Okeania sp. SIO3H1]NET24380.1 hypothetical protein [Okeania sp. SIO1I7]
MINAIIRMGYGETVEEKFLSNYGLVFQAENPFFLLYQFNKCSLQMVGKLHTTSVRKKEEGRRKKN